MFYSNVQVNDTWEADSAEVYSDTWNELTGNTQDNDSIVETLERTQMEEENGDISEDSSNESEAEDIVPISGNPSQNVQFETCVQPTDLSMEASRILLIAPGEGKRSLAILGDKKSEELPYVIFIWKIWIFIPKTSSNVN